VLPRHRRADVSPVLRIGSVTAELAVTAGVLVLLFLAWQLWWNNDRIAAGQASAAHALSEKWSHRTASVDLAATGEPLVQPEPAHGTVIGNLHVPRFGGDYVRTIAQGTSSDVLNSTQLGLGHYDGTQMPGGIGNFAIAGHRSAYGGALHLMDKLQVGDPIVVETADGWYTYKVTGVQVVEPSAVEVIAPVSGHPGQTATERTITLTTCTPLYSTAQRMVTTGLLDSWRPRAAGPPAGLAAEAAR
jgi:sortase A